MRGMEEGRKEGRNGGKREEREEGGRKEVRREEGWLTNLIITIGDHISSGIGASCRLPSVVHSVCQGPSWAPACSCTCSSSVSVVGPLQAGRGGAEGNL